MARLLLPLSRTTECKQRQMKTLTLFTTLCFLVPLSLVGQTFQGQQNIVVPPGAPGQTQGISISLASVSGVGVLGGCTVLESVAFDISHTWVGDVAIFLVSPSGTVLELTSANGGASDNWTGTVFRDDAPINIVNGAAPYTGVFRPEGRQQQTTPPFSNTPALETFTLENTFAGENADGDWQLLVNDFVAADIGVINNWELTFLSSGSGNLNGTLELSDPVVCAGTPVDITVTGSLPAGVTYDWSTGQTSSSITVSPLVTTTYAVTITDGACDQELDITVDPAIAPVIAGPATVCAGESITLTASGTGPFTWSTGQTGTSISVSPTTSTTYSVSDGPGSCSTSDDFVVTVTPISLALDVSTASVCPGEPVTLTAVGGTSGATYQWSTGAITPSISANPTTDQNYSVTLTEGSCSLVADFTVAVTDVSVNLGTDQTICAGETITLSGVGDGPFQWSTGALDNAVTVAPTVTTTYTATATQGSCTASDDITVTVLPAASVSASGTQTVCAGTPVTLTASGDGPFTWSNGAVGDNITVTPLATETFTVTAGTGACSATADVTVTVTPQPTLDLGGDQTFCAGDATTLTANGTFDDILWDNGESTATIPLHASGTVTYTATASNGSCSVTESVAITIIAAPEVTASNDQTICAGDSITLSATGTGPFLWNDGTQSPTLRVAPNTTTTFTVRVGSADCTATDEVVVNVTASPEVDLGPDLSLCVGATTSLASQLPADAYNWSNGFLGDSLVVTVLQDTSFSLQVTTNGCSATDTINLMVRDPEIDLGEDRTICPADSITLTAPAAEAYLWNTGFTGQTLRLAPFTDTILTLNATITGCIVRDTVEVSVSNDLSVDIGAAEALCLGDSLLLTASGTGPVTWSTGEVGPSIVVQPTTATQYFATVGTGNCAVTDSVDVAVLPPANIDVGADQTICAGEEVTITPVGDGVAFVWSTGAVSPTITLLPDTTLSVSVQATNADGCTANDTVNLRVITPEVELVDVPAICPGDTVALQATTATSYLWSTGETAARIRVAPQSSTTYQVTGFTENCPVIDSIEVMVLPRAAVSISGASTVCAGTTTTLLASGDGPFRWSDGSVGNSLDVSPVAPEVFFAVAGTGNCADTAFFSVAVFPAVTVALPADTAICQGDSIQLTAVAGGASLTWGDGDFGAQRMVAPDQTTTYQVAATLNGCIATDSVVVTVNSLPDILLAETECAPDNLTYTAFLELSGGLAPYQVNGTATTNTFSLDSLPSGTPFMSVVTDANGCTAEISGVEDCGCTEIVVAAAARGCNGSTERRDLSALLPAGVPAGSWQVLNPDANGLPALSGSLLSLENATPGTYTLQYVPAGAALECLADYQTTLQIDPPPTAGAQLQVEERCVSSVADILLADELTGATAGGTWEAISANTLDNQNVDLTNGVFRAAGQPEGVYRFLYRAPDGAGCPGSVAEVVIRLVSIEISGAVVPPDCETACSGAIVVGAPQSTWLYALDDEALSATARFGALCPGAYVLRAEDDRGCRAEVELTVPSVLIPEASLQGGGTIRLGDSTELELLANVAFDEVVWSGDVNCLTPDCSAVSVQPQSTTVYAVNFVSEFGCPGAATTTVIVDERVGVYVPTAFSPNGDGVNDLLTVYAGPAIRSVQGFRLFDRWGGQVADFEVVALGDDAFGWDGRGRNGQALNAGVYVYQLTYTREDGTTELLTGEVVLVR